ncbi:hypothetical protein QP166_09440 [Sphingomonas sp. LR60]|uniref:EAL domain-containing protein n=1 Tax=Sphingomonas sp. LR60 TaxID=3050233 RepID=UPI002FE202B5
MMKTGWQNIVRAMARTFGPGLSVRHANADPIRLTVRICNHTHISHAYGEDVAEDVVAKVARRLGQALPSSARIAQRPNGVLAATFGDDLEFGDDVVVALILAWFPTFCSAMMRRPVKTDAGQLCVWLSGDWDVSTVQNGRLFAFGGLPIEDTVEAAAHYRDDMALAAELLPLLLPEAAVKIKDRRCLSLHWQPIVDSGPGSTLYYESLLRHCGRDGVFQSPEAFICALERLGFACLVDRYVASAVLDELEAQALPPQVIPPTLDPNRAQDNIVRTPEPVPAAPPVVQAAPEQIAPEAAAATGPGLRRGDALAWMDHTPGSTVPQKHCWRVCGMVDAGTSPA